MSPEPDSEFPWHRCAPGEAFFIPSLDLVRTAREGMRAARDVIKSGDASYRVGIYNDQLVVLFSVKRRSIPRSVLSADTSQEND